MNITNIRCNHSRYASTNPPTNTSEEYDLRTKPDGSRELAVNKYRNGLSENRIYTVTQEQYGKIASMFEELNIIDYVKIPHHGSDGSKEMFNLLSNVNKVSNSVSTVYRTSRLPKKEILEMYKRKKGKVFCTGNLNREDNINNYGIIKHTFDIINKTVKTELIENANEL